MLKAIRRPNASADKLEPLIPISQTRQKLVFAKHLILEGRIHTANFWRSLRWPKHRMYTLWVPQPWPKSAPRVRYAKSSEKALQRDTARRPRGCRDHQRTGRRLRPSGLCYLERPSSRMNRSTSRASTPPAIAAVGNCERDFRWTTINRPDRLGEARRNESSGAAMEGRTVFPAFASTNHRFELGCGTRKSTSKPC